MIYNCTRCQGALAASTRFCARCGLGFPAPVPLDAEPGPAYQAAPIYPAQVGTGNTSEKKFLERFDPPAFGAGHRAPSDPILGFSLWRVVVLVLLCLGGIAAYVILHMNTGN